jgi:hypothetical protein
MAREVRQIEFQPTDADTVLDAMATITDAADGWINLLPGINEDDAPPKPTGLSAILAPRTPGTVMGTWAPQTQGRHGPQGANIGLLHTGGRFAARKLAELGTPLPQGWVVRQDNPRRGLIVIAAIDTPNDEVLQWTIAACTALCSLVTTGSWRADIYLPKAGLGSPA